MNGKQKRLERILKNEKAIIIPMDHGVTNGPVQGLENMDEIVEKVDKAGATAVVLHKGVIKSLKKPPDCGIIMHLSASTELALDVNNKVQVGTVEEAIRLGADAVSVHVNIGGSEHEPEMLQKLGRVAEECERLQVPLMAMMYPRGKNVTNALDQKNIALVARVGAELGADLVKTVYTGNVKTFRKVVESCPVPIVIAGGPKCKTDKEVLEMVKEAMDAGAIGVSIGRNVFQHKTPEKMVLALSVIIKENGSVKAALDVLK
ncbi:MAG: 2-amino-3,7-dideoxy-D-threo-hept-6-ulosonate synthase [Candidatus Altiarchaeota archaeon]